MAIITCEDLLPRKHCLQACVDYFKFFTSFLLQRSITSLSYVLSERLLNEKPQVLRKVRFIAFC